MLKALRLCAVLQAIDFEWHNKKEEGGAVCSDKMA